MKKTFSDLPFFDKLKTSMFALFFERVVDREMSNFVPEISFTCVHEINNHNLIPDKIDLVDNSASINTFVAEAARFQSSHTLLASR